MGHTVCGVDDDPRVIAGLNSGRAPVDEPGLGDLLRRNLAAARLAFSSDFPAALHDAEFAYLALDTPVG
jgi:UDPglucose 6-dehydrogenase